MLHHVGHDADGVQSGDIPVVLELGSFLGREGVGIRREGDPKSCAVIQLDDDFVDHARLPRLRISFEYL